MNKPVHIVDHTDARNLRPGDAVVLVHLDDGRRAEGDLIGMSTIGGRTLAAVTVETVAMTADYVIDRDAWMVAAAYRRVPVVDAVLDQPATITNADIAARLNELADALEDIAAAKPTPDPAAAIDREVTETALRLAELSIITLPDAARDVVDHQGEPGGMARHARLLDVVTQIRTEDPHADVLISAAVWLDRRGSQGAPDRLGFLADAIERAEPSGDAS